MRPSSRDKFAIAIICALTLEAEAVEDLFDETYDRLGEYYRKEPGDDNAYVNGRIGKHNVVVCYMPSMGKGSAASVASSLKISYKRIEVALVVGVCGGAPYPSSGGEVFLGDVIISDSVVQYDFGEQYPGSFEKKTGVKDTLGRPNRAIRSILASLQARQSRRDLQNKLLRHLQMLQGLQPDWYRPTSVEDVLFEASYQHKHYSRTSATCLCLDSMSEDICKAAVDSTCTLLGCDLNQYWEPTAREETNKFHIPLDLSAVPAIEEFIGREDDLNRLWDYLQPRSPPTRKVAVLHGLGGIGKTQLAIHFARKHKVDFSAIFWLSGKDRSALVSSLSSCLSRIQGQPADLKATNEEEAEQRANQVLQWLAMPGNTRWLIIFDNIDHYSPLQGHGDCGYNIYEFFPKADHGSIIITSRLQGLTELGKLFPVQKLMHKDAIQLLLQSSTFSAEDIARTGAEQDIIDIASLLDGLSLAIVIAGAFMRQTGTNVKEYTELYRTSWFNLQSQSGPTRHYQQGNMIQTWMITYQEIQKRDPIAAKLLLLLAFFDNQDIWYELIHSGMNYSDPPAWFKTAVSTKLVFKTKLRVLIKFSLVETGQQEGSYTLHPVVQDWCTHIAASKDLTNQLHGLALISVGFMVPSSSDRRAS
ncbi:hypothetical protein ETB97_010885 [Aspergillus alliaceus]|uniref:Nucleoside phosphorylase domain-containing protein n=1 Tax=Petromyces alliaceus TaxID=209559 RepID=A0A8H5ZQ99_PETAA|nr:hypothetical protein ETB97_010885 [Aspergillus burnettii]